MVDIRVIQSSSNPFLGSLFSDFKALGVTMQPGDRSVQEQADEVAGSECRVAVLLDEVDGAGEIQNLGAAERIRRDPHWRKDIFTVLGVVTGKELSDDERFHLGLGAIKRAGVNLAVVVDASGTHRIVTPEESWYGDDEETSSQAFLLDMVLSRCRGTFTRSKIVGTADDLVPWGSDQVPSALRAVVDGMIDAGAYRAFNGKTVGHFAVRSGDGTFLTSARNTNFNTDLRERGLVRVESSGPDDVTAYGMRPSVGGQSQRIVFTNHPGYDCIAHAHVPLRVRDSVNTVPQWLNECGSHGCGKATSDGLREVAPGIKAVYLDRHGPNIVFKRDVDPENVLAFIRDHFDLSAKTRGATVE